MAKAVVDQLSPTGELIFDIDRALSETDKNDLLLRSLPGATIETYCGVRVIRLEDQIIFKKQVTHLGHPWPPFKKRIQIPQSWIVAERQARAEGLVPRFVGIYQHGQVTVFVDFDPTTYVQRKANNSAAHVATNDLYQALTLGQFSRVDGNGNRLTSVSADQLRTYLLDGYRPAEQHVGVLRRFNEAFLDGRQVDGLSAIKEMHEARWPDAFQGEWPGFYLEYRLDRFLRREGLDDLVKFQKVKRRNEFDYDLAFGGSSQIEFLGDLKASDVTKHEAPGNDAEDIARCVREFGKFWYVIYEHETHHARDNGDIATIAWNEWKRSVGYQRKTEYNPLSYSRRFKESVRFLKMMVLEVNEANFGIVLGHFRQGRQPGGADRALKVMISKRNIDNFLVYSAEAD